jgi:hypothetical protein
VVRPSSLPVQQRCDPAVAVTTIDLCQFNDPRHQPERAKLRMNSDALLPCYLVGVLETQLKPLTPRSCPQFPDVTASEFIRDDT